MYPELTSFKVEGATLIPQEVVDRVMKERAPGLTNMKTLAQAKNIVEGWCAPRHRMPTLPLLRARLHAVCAARLRAEDGGAPAGDDCLYLVSC